MKSKVITLSAISAAFVAICLTVGVYIEIADIFCIIISSIFVLLPLYYNSYKGCVMSALVGGVLGFILSWFNVLNIVFPTFLTFFGVFPILKCFFQDRNVSKILTFIVGLIWCVAVFYGGYFYYTLIMKLPLLDLPIWIADNVLLFVGLIGAVFFVIYNRFIDVVRIFIFRTLSRIIK